jgi:three-Cys-motif partner protein
VPDFADLPRGEQDGHPTPDVGSWAREKYLRVWMYDQMFATGMKNRWDEIVYLDLFSGSGYSRIRGTNDILQASPLLALQIPDRFHRYIYCDREPTNLDALRRRVDRHAPGVTAHYVPGDIDETIGQVLELIPRGSSNHRVLSFCFVDPFSVDLRFSTIRRLSERYVDFLILLALGMDANLNLPVYIEDHHTRIEQFLDNPNWRAEWRTEEARGVKFIPFMAQQYARAMTRLRYLETPLDRMYPVRSDQRNLPLYYLAFFSRNPRGFDFWGEVMKYADPQLGLGLTTDGP